MSLWYLGCKLSGNGKDGWWFLSLKNAMEFFNNVPQVVVGTLMRTRLCSGYGLGDRSPLLQHSGMVSHGGAVRGLLSLQRERKRKVRWVLDWGRIGVPPLCICGLFYPVVTLFSVCTALFLCFDVCGALMCGRYPQGQCRR